MDQSLVLQQFSIALVSDSRLHLNGLHEKDFLIILIMEYLHTMMPFMLFRVAHSDQMINTSSLQLAQLIKKNKLSIPLLNR